MDKKNDLSHQRRKFIASLSRGFTLIELLAVFALIGILTALSIAGFSNYNKSQAFESSVSDVATMLGSARSRALSQVKPCAVGQTLNGYQVKITPGGSDYELDVVCTGVPPALIQQKKLPLNVTFKNPGSVPQILFTVLTGTPVPAGTILITNGTKTRTITVSSSGVITVT